MHAFLYTSGHVVSPEFMYVKPEINSDANELLLAVRLACIAFFLRFLS